MDVTMSQKSKMINTLFNASFECGFFINKEPPALIRNV
jgi:hypothetical protein